jgi:hypothetical protein
MGEWAKRRTGEARIRVADKVSLRGLLRQGELMGLMECRRINLNFAQKSPRRPFAVSPTRPFASWLLPNHILP